MAIKIKAIQKAQPGVAGGGVKKWYASPVTNGEASLDDLTKSIEKICTVSGADIRAVLYALVDVSVDELSNGTIVRMGDLGSLRASIKSEGVAEEKDVSDSIVKSSNIIFTPGSRLKDMLATVKYKKA